jgi:uncharacterized protein (TIGR02118 family)
MIKVLAMLKRKSTITSEEFSKYWFETHGPLALKLQPPSITAGIKYYIQNHALKLGKSEPPYDAVAETVFYDLDSFWKWNEWYFSEAGKPLRDDEENFMDTSRRVIVITDERVVLNNSNPAWRHT